MRRRLPFLLFFLLLALPSPAAETDSAAGPRPMTAEDLCDQIAADGGDCSSVSYWSETGWVTHAAGSPINNFTLESGVGYLTSNGTAVTASFSGGYPTNITMSLVENWNLLEARGIENVMILGVHTNMCVLGRPFGLRQMAHNGKNVVLVRDLTDTMYNSRSRGASCVS